MLITMSPFYGVPTLSSTYPQQDMKSSWMHLQAFVISTNSQSISARQQQWCLNLGAVLLLTLS